MLRHILLALVLPLMLLIGMSARSDDSTDLEIRIRGPVDSVDATANTITVFGLKISVPATALNGNSGGKGGDVRSDSGGGSNSGGDGENNGGDNGGNGGNGGGTPITLASILPGTIVEIKLASDMAPLTAVEVSEQGGYGDNIGIKAPIQAVDATGKIVTMLGLTIDISTATLDGSNEDDSESVPATPTALAAGQSAEVSFDKTKLPALVATRIEVKNFTNQVDVELDDNSGNQVGDDTEDTTVDAMQNVTVTDTSTGKKLKKTIHIHTTTRHGKVNLSGLVAGKAKLTIKRHGKKYSKTVTIAANGTNSVKIKVK